MYGNGPQKNEVEHTFQQGGTYTVRCTAYHGFTFFGYKFQSTRQFEIDVLPSLPLTIGVFTINGDSLVRVGKKEDKRYRVTGNVTVNSVISLDNDVIADFVKEEVTIQGALNVPAAGNYSNVLSTAKALTFNAKTGTPKSVELSGIEAKFEIAFEDGHFQDRRFAVIGGLSRIIVELRQARSAS